VITKAIALLLAQQTAVTAIVNDRIRVGAIEKNEQMPAMDIRVSASGNTPQSLDGDKPGFQSFVTIDCYSELGHDQADLLASKLYAQVILGYRGTIGGCVIRGITADGAPVQDEETVDPASTKRRYVTTVGYSVSWAMA